MAKAITTNFSRIIQDCYIEEIKDAQVLKDAWFLPPSFNGSILHS
jgi:hypothetical protein